MILSLLAAAALALPQGEAPRVLYADRVQVGDGTVLEGAVITLADGRIQSVARGPAPEGALHVPGAWLTPGLVDACSTMGVTAATTEESKEATPRIRIAETADLDSAAFRRALENGITTAFLTPDSVNCIGGLGALVKTAGGPVADLFAPEASGARVLDPEAALKLTLGTETSAGNGRSGRNGPRDLFGRRPTTRMSAVWILRREFYRARAWMEARERGEAPEDPDLEVLARALRGEIPVRVQARRAHDIQTALRLQEEFGWPRLVIEEGQEAWRIRHVLQEHPVPLVCAPLYDRRSRGLVQGPTAEDLAAWVRPPAVCCEDLGHHDHDLGAAFDEIYSIETESGLLPLSDGVLGVLLALASPRYGWESASPVAARGLPLGRRADSGKPTPAQPALLAAAGLPFVLASVEAHDTPESAGSLIQQARTAVAWGLDPARALQAVTSGPARLLGLDERLGLVAAGRDADLVLWSGDPLDAASRPLLVLVDGRVAVDRR